jgi:DNA modification methylase
MQNVTDTIKEKEKMFLELRHEMQHIINYEKREYKRMDNNSEDFITEDCHLMKGDCVTRIKEISDNSIGFSIFSPPFADLYTYSDHYQDMGNSNGLDEFYIHFDYLVSELFRVTQQGRLVSFHCMNMPTSKQKHGYIGIQDFRGDLIRIFQKHGFIYHSEVVIWKDPVIAMQRTKARGLLHCAMEKDSSISRQGIPDYLVTMRKPGINENPIQGKFDHFVGEDFKSEGNLSIDIWQRYASPIWMDINPSNTLQYMAGRSPEDERHICPLQLDVIHRALQLWTNDGDTVLTPFAGIGSEVYESLKMKRKAIGIELKDSYFQQAIKNINTIYEERDQLDLGYAE